MSTTDTSLADEYAAQLEALRATDNPRSALDAAESAWADAGSELDPDRPATFALATLIAELRARLGDLETAEALLEATIELARANGLDDAAASALTTLAFALDEAGDQPRALAAYERAIPAVEKAFGLERLELATLLNNLAVLRKNAGEFERAESLYLRAIEIYRAAHGKFHPDLATAMNNLGVFYCERGDLKAAEAMHLKALIIRQNVCRHTDPDLAQSYTNLAVVYHQRGWLDKAESFYQKAIGIFNAQREPAPSEQRTFTFQNYATLLRMVGNESLAATIEARLAQA